jgi:TPR repeat protein
MARSAWLAHCTLLAVVLVRCSRVSAVDPTQWLAPYEATSHYLRAILELEAAGVPVELDPLDELLELHNITEAEAAPAAGPRMSGGRGGGVLTAVSALHWAAEQGHAPSLLLLAQLRLLGPRNVMPVTVFAALAPVRFPPSPFASAVVVKVATRADAVLALSAGISAAHATLLAVAQHAMAAEAYRLGQPLPPHVANGPLLPLLLQLAGDGSLTQREAGREFHAAAAGGGFADEVGWQREPGDAHAVSDVVGAYGDGSTRLARARDAIGREAGFGDEFEDGYEVGDAESDGAVPTTGNPLAKGSDCARRRAASFGHTFAASGGRGAGRGEGAPVEVSLAWLEDGFVGGALNTQLRADLAARFADYVSQYNSALATACLMHLARMPSAAWWAEVDETSLEAVLLAQGQQHAASSLVEAVDNAEAHDVLPELLDILHAHRVSAQADAAGVRADENDRLRAWETSWTAIPAALVRAVLPAWLVGRTTPAHDSTQQDAAATKSGRAASHTHPRLPLFPSDAHALAVLESLALRRVQVAQVALAYRLMSHLPPGLAAAHNDVDAYRAVLLLLPISQQAAGDATLPPSPNSEASSAPLWEVHEDAQLVTLAGEQEMNVEYVRQLADEEADPDAMMQMGEVHMFGQPHANIRPDVHAALRYFQRAAAHGLPEAHAQVGTVMLDSLPPGDPARNLTAAMEHLEAAAAAGSGTALAGLGYVYQTGEHGVARNLSRATEYLARAAGAGVVSAHSNLAALYLTADADGGSSDGVRANVTAARWHLEQAAAAGAEYVPALFNLGLMELYGWDRGGVAAPATAARHMKIVADSAAWASATLFSLEAALNTYLSGDAEAPHTALAQYLMLAQLGVASAQDSAAFLLTSQTVGSTVIDAAAAVELGVLRAHTGEQHVEHPALLSWLPLDIQSPVPGERRHTHRAPLTGGSHIRGANAYAFDLLMRAAENNYSHAQHRLGDCFSHGWAGVAACDVASVPVSNMTARALEAYGKAAAGGLGHAMYTLGVAHTTGQVGQLPVEVNNTLAWEWLERCSREDPFADLPVVAAKANAWARGIARAVVWPWQAGSSVPSATDYNGASLFNDLLQCLIVWPDWAQGQTRGSTAAASHGEGHARWGTRGPRHEVGDGVDFDASKDDGVEAPRTAFAGYVAGIPLTSADRLACSVLARSLAVAAAVVASVMAVSTIVVTAAALRRGARGRVHEHAQ